MAAPFVHRLRVRYSDCDPQGVVFFANHLEYFDVAVGELWRHAIGPYDEMVAGGVDMVVAEAGIRYLAPLPFDADAEIAVTVRHLGTTSMRSTLEIRTGGVLCSEGEVRHVFVPTDGGGKTPIPDDIRTGLAPYLG